MPNNARLTLLECLCVMDIFFFKFVMKLKLTIETVDCLVTVQRLAGISVAVVMSKTRPRVICEVYLSRTFRCLRISHNSQRNPLNALCKFKHFETLQ